MLATHKIWKNYSILISKSARDTFGNKTRVLRFPRRPLRWFEKPPFNEGVSIERSFLSLFRSHDRALWQSSSWSVIASQVDWNWRWRVFANECVWEICGGVCHHHHRTRDSVSTGFHSRATLNDSKVSLWTLKRHLVWRSVRGTANHRLKSLIRQNKSSALKRKRNSIKPNGGSWAFF